MYVPRWEPIGAPILRTRFFHFDVSRVNVFDSPGASGGTASSTSWKGSPQVAFTASGEGVWAPPPGCAPDTRPQILAGTSGGHGEDELCAPSSGRSVAF